MAGNKPINKPIRGIRDSIPGGYVVGRTGAGSGPPILLPAGQFTTKGYVANTTIQVGGAAGGDLSGTYPNPTVAKIQGNPVSSAAPSNGQVLEWNGTNWVPTNISAGAPASVLDNGTLYFALEDVNGQLVLDSSGNPIFAAEVLPASSIPPLKGVTDGSDAAAGIVGEFTSASRSNSSTINLASAGTPADITSLTLTAGDWDISGSAGISNSVAPTGINFESAWTSTTSATFPSPFPDTSFAQVDGHNLAPTGDTVFSVGTKRFSFNTSTTVYLSARASYTGGQMTAYGIIRARRTR